MILGGQLRLTRLFTPQLHEQVMQRKAVGTAQALYPLIPIRDPRKQMQFVGALMVGTGVLLAMPVTRGSNITLALCLGLTGAGIYRYDCIP